MAIRSDKEDKRIELEAQEIKDLKPENRAKRKEPKKPWGKKERLIVLLTLITTVSASFFLYISSFSFKAPQLRIPNLKFGNLFEETFVLENQNQTRKSQKREKIKRLFREKTENLSGLWGLYVVDLSDGSSFGVNENKVFTAASLIKLPVMLAMYQEFQAGSLDPLQTYSLTNKDKIPGAGILYGKPQGYEVTYEELVNLMGKYSDNTAFGIARKILGDEKIDNVIKKAGMVSTSIINNETTPMDVGEFFKRLWDLSLTDKESRDKILESLTQTSFEDWLRKGIPSEVSFAHKFGREINVVNDAGIVLSDHPFVLVVLSKGIIEKEANQVFPELSSAIYEEMGSD